MPTNITVLLQIHLQTFMFHDIMIHAEKKNEGALHEKNRQIFSREILQKSQLKKRVGITPFREGDFIMPPVKSSLS